MRWPTNTPKIGDARQNDYFAWLPVECQNGETVWLERYTVCETFTFGDKWQELWTLPTAELDPPRKWKEEGEK